jgi:hypothetical protein
LEEADGGAVLYLPRQTIVVLGGMMHRGLSHGCDMMDSRGVVRCLES